MRGCGPRGCFRTSALGVVLLLGAAPAFGQSTPSRRSTEADAASLAQSTGGFTTLDLTRGSGMRAYHAAIARRRLGSADAMRLEAVQVRVTEAEVLVSSGRYVEAIGKLTEVVEHPKFELVAETEEGRAALYLLGHALAAAGIHESARAYLRASIEGKTVWEKGGSYARRSARKLVEIALETHLYRQGLTDLAASTGAVPAEIRGEMAYLTGKAKEAEGDREGALEAYARVPQVSRFWSQANYLAGIVQVERGRLKEGENLFCKVADPKRQDRSTPVLADERFFAVRDLARLALGRVAHEQARFDDARYYYYLVPRDSDRLAEALYEAATTRYEKKDYEGARELLDDLVALKTHHRYEDEAFILDAYIDLARCRFPEADRKLARFLRGYEPVRDATRRFLASDSGLRALVESARSGAQVGDAFSASASPETFRAVAERVRVDPLFGEASRRGAIVEREQTGLKLAGLTIRDMAQSLATPLGVRPHVDSKAALSSPRRDAENALDEARKQLSSIEQANAGTDKLASIRKELRDLELRLSSEARPSGLPLTDAPATTQLSPGLDLTDLLARDEERAKSLGRELDGLRTDLLKSETALAKDALRRLDLRLSRLLRRARLGRIESVLGKKRALETEIEAFNAGYLPKDALDSLDAARTLRDGEEYWPFEGDDWPDEFLGTEGLK